MDAETDLLKIKIEKAKAELGEDTLKAIDAVDWRAAILKMRETKGYTFEQLENLETETELLLCGLLSPNDYPKELKSRMELNENAVNDLVNDMNQEVFSKIREEMIKNTEQKNTSATTIPIKETAGIINPIKINPPEMTKDKEDTHKILNSHGIEIVEKRETLPVLEKLELTGKSVPPAAPVPINPPIIKKPEIVAPIIQPQKEKSNIISPQNSATPKKDEIYPVRSPEGSQGAPTSNGMHPMLAQKMSNAFQIPSIKTEHTLENITKAPAAATIPTITKAKPGVDPYREVPE